MHTYLSITGALLVGGGLLALAAVLFTPRRPVVVSGWDAEADDHLRGLRIAADDQEHDDLWGYPALPAAPVLDKRTAQVVASLPAIQAAEVLAQVAPGAGSVVSVAAAQPITQLRTSVERAQLLADWDAALAEAPEREAAIEVRRTMAVFELRMDRALEAFRAATGRADMWVHYLHEVGTEHCSRCDDALNDISGEYHQLVARVLGEPTGQMALVSV